MGRALLAVISLVAAVGWLVLAYRPGLLPGVNLAFPGGWVEGLFRSLLVVSAVLFILVQSILLAASLRLPERIGRSGEGLAVEEAGLRPVSPVDISVNRTAELVWTGIPLMMTVGLVGLGYWVLAG